VKLFIKPLAVCFFTQDKGLGLGINITIALVYDKIIFQQVFLQKHPILRLGYVLESHVK
jgi:hypothetical protein